MTEASRKACPVCGRPEDPAFRPFCSQRCADIDLGRWINERYVIPAEPDADQLPNSQDPDT